ncbi:NEQ404 [Nanoarchaeum equitans Kin4-M]|uniref:NEQ404 n=1 Tax=Nanoarchaeum equitans (strain Kin4-M) TaxID=228908 RepID=Q74ME9_NANEQ|nr:NEQ404 [Nanoarchaeum equitans Kin4-M]
MGNMPLRGLNRSLEVLFEAVLLGIFLATSAFVINKAVKFGEKPSNVIDFLVSWYNSEKTCEDLNSIRKFLSTVCIKDGYFILKNNPTEDCSTIAKENHISIKIGDRTTLVSEILNSKVLVSEQTGSLHDLYVTYCSPILITPRYSNILYFEVDALGEIDKLLDNIKKVTVEVSRIIWNCDFKDIDSDNKKEIVCDLNSIPETALKPGNYEFVFNFNTVLVRKTYIIDGEYDENGNGYIYIGKAKIDAQLVKKTPNGYIKADVCEADALQKGKLILENPLYKGESVEGIPTKCFVKINPLFKEKAVGKYIGNYFIETEKGDLTYLERETYYYGKGLEVKCFAKDGLHIRKINSNILSKIGKRLCSIYKQIEGFTICTPEGKPGKRIEAYDICGEFETDFKILINKEENIKLKIEPTKKEYNNMEIFVNGEKCDKEVNYYICETNKDNIKIEARYDNYYIGWAQLNIKGKGSAYIELNSGEAKNIELAPPSIDVEKLANKVIIKITADKEIKTVCKKINYINIYFSSCEGKICLVIEYPCGAKLDIKDNTVIITIDYEKIKEIKRDGKTFMFIKKPQYGLKIYRDKYYLCDGVLKENHIEANCSFDDRIEEIDLWYKVQLKAYYYINNKTLEVLPYIAIYNKGKPLELLPSKFDKEEFYKAFEKELKREAVNLLKNPYKLITLNFFILDDGKSIWLNNTVIAIAYACKWRENKFVCPMDWNENNKLDRDEKRIIPLHIISEIDNIKPIDYDFVFSVYSRGLTDSPEYVLDTIKISFIPALKEIDTPKGYRLKYGLKKIWVDEKPNVHIINNYDIVYFPRRTALVISRNKVYGVIESWPHAIVNNYFPVWGGDKLELRKFPEKTFFKEYEDKGWFSSTTYTYYTGDWIGLFFKTNKDSYLVKDVYGYLFLVDKNNNVLAIVFTPSNNMDGNDIDRKILVNGDPLFGNKHIILFHIDTIIVPLVYDKYSFPIEVNSTFLDYLNYALRKLAYEYVYKRAKDIIGYPQLVTMFYPYITLKPHSYTFNNEDTKKILDNLKEELKVFNVIYKLSDKQK